MEWNRSNDQRPTSYRGDKPMLQYGQQSIAMKQYAVNGDLCHPDVYCKTVVEKKKRSGGGAALALLSKK